MSITPGKVIVLAPASLLPPVAPAAATTPYGTIQLRWQGGIAWVAAAEPGAPRASQALIYGAKEMGAERVIDLLPVWATNRLLQPGDILLCTDLLDLTRGRCSTFFVGKGYGFVPQNPPGCPLLHAALLAAARQVVATMPRESRRPRVFGRGTCAAIEGEGWENTPPEAEEWWNLARWGADAVGSGGVPACFLARELELCYTPLGYVVAALHGHIAPDIPTIPTIPTMLLFQPAPAPASAGTLHAPVGNLVSEMLEALAAALPAERACACPHIMQPARERNLVGDDWRSWVAR